VYGIATGGTAYAGYFDGDVYVNGALTTVVAASRIDHPLDPENKYLQHGVVESDRMKNVYDGVAVLDSDGRTEVQLPAWFEKVNGDFRYQLTCVGGYAPVYVESEIANNAFTIAGGKPGLKVSWQVTGVRKDAYSEAHPMVAELEKAPRDRGKFVHPELFGYGRDRLVGEVPALTQDMVQKERLVREAVKTSARGPQPFDPQIVRTGE
jgi:hypothetical protein